MKTREPKAGDRCEHAQYNPTTYRRNRDCQVLHLQGKPPGQLVVRRDQGQSVLVCSKHAEGMELISVRKQKPRKADAKQVDVDFGIGESVTKVMEIEFNPVGVVATHPNHNAKGLHELFQDVAKTAIEGFRMEGTITQKVNDDFKIMYPGIHVFMGEKHIGPKFSSPMPEGE